MISIQKRGKVYQYRFEAASVNGKLLEYRIVKTVRKSKSLKNLDLIFRKENGIYSGTEETLKEASENFEDTVKSETINKIIKFKN